MTGWVIIANIVLINLLRNFGLRESFYDCIGNWFQPVISGIKMGMRSQWNVK